MGTELPGSSTQAVRDDAQWGWNPRGVFDGMSGVMDAARNSVYSPTNLKMPSLEMPPVQSPLSLFAARNTTDAGVEDECQALRAAKVFDESLKAVQCKHAQQHIKSTDEQRQRSDKVLSELTADQQLVGEIRSKVLRAQEGMSTLKGKLPEVLPFFQSHRTKKDTEGALHQTSSALEQLLELVNQVDAALQAKCRDAQHLALELQAKMDALKAEQATLQTQAGDGKELFEKLKEAHVQRDVALARMEAAQDSLEAALKARDQFPKVCPRCASLGNEDEVNGIPVFSLDAPSTPSPFSNIEPAKHGDMADRSLLESRIHDLENVAKKEKYDRTHAEGKLDALRSQLDALRSSMLASGAALPVDFAKSMDRIDLESDALGQIAAAASKLEINGIIEVMNRFSDVARVQSCGCRALSDLAYDEGMKDKIAAAGGLDVIMCALNRHRLNVETQEYACTSLWNLMSSHPRIRDRIMQMGAIDSTLKAMRSHTESAQVQEEACLVLYNLAFDRDHYRQDHPMLHKYAGWCLERLEGLVPGSSSPPRGGRVFIAPAGTRGSCV